MEYITISENTLEHVSFHDCNIDKAYVLNNGLVLEFDHLDVLPTHPLNPFSVAKYTDKAAIIFESFHILNSILHDTSKISKKNIRVEEDAQIVQMDLLELATDFEVLKVENISAVDSFVMEFHGTASLKHRAEFGDFTVRFQNAKVCWNDLIDDAWFVGRDQS